MGKNVKFFGITRTNILRIMSLTVILAFIMPGITNAQSGKANFAGNWTYNASKSTPPPTGGGGGGGGTPGKYVATWSADGKTLTIVTTRTTQNGERKSSEAWTLTDANTLTRTTTSNNNGTENKRVAVYEKK